MRYLFYAVFCLMIIIYLTGCGGGKPVSPPYQYSKQCIDGVVYYKRAYRMAPAWNRDGTLKLCEE